MANNQELQEDFSQDVKDDQHFNGDEAGENGTDNGTENGNENGNDAAQQNENSEQGQQGGEAASGRDDDRLVDFFSIPYIDGTRIAISASSYQNEKQFKRFFLNRLEIT